MAVSLQEFILTVEVGAKKYLIRLEHRIVASKFFNFGFNHTQVVKPVLAVLRVFCFGRPFVLPAGVEKLLTGFLFSQLSIPPLQTWAHLWAKAARLCRCALVASHG